MEPNDRNTSWHGLERETVMRNKNTVAIPDGIPCRIDIEKSIFKVLEDVEGYEVSLFIQREFELQVHVVCGKLHWAARISSRLLSECPVDILTNEVIRAKRQIEAQERAEQA